MAGRRNERLSVHRNKRAIPRPETLSVTGSEYETSLTLSGLGLVRSYAPFPSLTWIANVQDQVLYSCFETVSWTTDKIHATGQF